MAFGHENVPISRQYGGDAAENASNRPVLRRFSVPIGGEGSNRHRRLLSHDRCRANRAALDDLVIGLVGKQALRIATFMRLPAAIGAELADEEMAGQSQITDCIENLVAHESSGYRKPSGLTILSSPTATVLSSEAPSAKPIFQSISTSRMKTERPRARHFGGVAAVIQLENATMATDQGRVVVDLDVEREPSSAGSSSQ